MKIIIWAILFCTIVTTAAAKDGGYHLGNAPWSNETFEVCPTDEQDSFRTVVFEPEIEEWSYTLTEFPSVKLVATENGITEVVSNGEKIRPAYFLKSQKIGFLNSLNQWVRQDGELITDFEQFDSISGTRVQPKIKPHHERRVYKSKIDLEHAAALQKLHYSPPCTAFEVGHYDKLESNLQYEFGDNNPLQCDEKNGTKRSDKFNYSETIHRPVVAYADGTSYFIKFPNGDSISFGWTGIERLYDEDGTLICDWGEIPQFAGYELLQRD